MTVAKSSAASIKIHINTVKPVLEGMRALGFSQEACLEGTDLHLNQISEMLGFSEASAFTNAFKTWESISPKDYRLNNR